MVSTTTRTARISRMILVPPCNAPVFERKKKMHGTAFSSHAWGLNDSYIYVIYIEDVLTIDIMVK
jgi:hypothetical protein